MLESNVSKTAVKFDPISAVDDEFYEYFGGKDKDGECHGNGYLEYDDGSYISGSWIHGVREGHFRYTILLIEHLIYLNWWCFTDLIPVIPKVLCYI